jgi:enoyl-CoA hydratase
LLGSGRSAIHAAGDTVSFPKVHYEKTGAVAVLRLDDGKANAVSHELIEEFCAALDKARAEASAVLIAGRPGRFSAGFDLAKMTASPESARALVTAGCELLMRLYLHPQPVVVACTGHALAAGALILLAADRRIGAAGDFKIGLNEVAIGLRLPIFAVELARERLSKRHFTPATVLGHVYDPADAVDVGYLDATVEPARVIETALAEAEVLAGLPSSALAQTKMLARNALVEHVRATLAEDMSRVAPPTQARKV